MGNPVSRRIKDEYKARIDILRENCMSGNYIDNKETYALDVGYVKALEQLLVIWEDPHSFMEFANEGLEESDYEA